MSPSMIFNSFLKFEIFNPGDSHKLHFQIKVCRSWQLSVENVPNDIVLRNQCTLRKKPSVGVLMKRYSQNMQPIYRKTTTPKCDFYKVALQLDEVTFLHGGSLVCIISEHLFLRMSREDCFWHTQQLFSGAAVCILVMSL